MSAYHGSKEGSDGILLQMEWGGQEKCCQCSTFLFTACQCSALTVKVL